jgi:hypothetical protein
VSIVEKLERAREAVDRRDWPLAYELLRQADDLGAEDTMALATSAYLTGNFNAAVQALQRGYQARVRDQDPLGAVRFASWLGLVLNVQGEFAVGAGWISRAQSLPGGQPEGWWNAATCSATSSTAAWAAETWPAPATSQPEWSRPAGDSVTTT